jgi:hypothetical protein
MIDSLPNDHSAKFYIKKNCSWCIEPLNFDTGFSKSILSSETISTSIHTHSLNDGTAIAKQYPDSGIYVFIDLETEKLNIGSCTRFYTRLVNHFNDSKNLIRPLYNRCRELGGIEKFN